ncbi:MAG: hypothetical protein ACAI44_28010 [Candidatus Sericytochromatia bacterium]
MAISVLKVTYTVQDAFVARNQENIARVMQELRDSGRTDIQYSAFLEADGKTFMHLVIKPDAGTPGPNELPAFQTFIAELQASQPEKPPVLTEIAMVGSNTSFF